jgi:hypothetical protein
MSYWLPTAAAGAAAAALLSLLSLLSLLLAVTSECIAELPTELLLCAAAAVVPAAV